MIILSSLRNKNKKVYILKNKFEKKKIITDILQLNLINQNNILIKKKDIICEVNKYNNIKNYSSKKKLEISYQMKKNILFKKFYNYKFVLKHYTDKVKNFLKVLVTKNIIKSKMDY